jgi:putative flippase GtrA
LSRSEDDELLVVTLGVAGGIASLVWFLGLHLAKGATTKIAWWHYVLGFLAAAVAGVIAVETAYRAQDVWSFGENAGSAVVAAFTGATTGAMVAALAVLFPEPSEEDEDDADE